MGYRRIYFRRDSLSNWNTSNSILGVGEIGLIDSNTNNHGWYTELYFGRNTTAVESPRRKLIFDMIGTPDILKDGTEYLFLRFCGNILDAHGHNFYWLGGSAIYEDINTPSYPIFVFNNARKCLRLNGSNFLSMDSSLPDSDNISFSFWIWLFELKSSRQLVIFDGNNVSGYDFSFRFWNSNRSGFRTKNAPDDTLTIPDSIVNRHLNRWAHYCAVADATHGYKKIYLNGQEIASEPYSGRANVGYHNNFRIGVMDDGQYRDGQLNARLFSLRLFTRALTSSEVRYIYKAERAIFKKLTH